MPNPSMAVKDIHQEQGDEMPAFPISREERKSVVQVALLLLSEQSRSYCALQKWCSEVGKKSEERSTSPPFSREEGPSKWDLVQQGPLSGFDEPLKCN